MTIDIAALLGLTRTELRRVRAIEQEREERSRRERMLIAAAWATKQGAPTAMDSKGWPVDANDWPLRPHPGMLPETTRDYRRAITRAKTRRTLRAKAAWRAKDEAFDIRKIDLSGVRAICSVK